MKKEQNYSAKKNAMGNSWLKRYRKKAGSLAKASALFFSLGLGLAVGGGIGTGIYSGVNDFSQANEVFQAEEVRQPTTYLEELEELRSAIVDLGVYDVDEELGQQTLEVPNTEGETVDRAWFYMCNEGEEETTRVTVAYFSNGDFDITGGVFGRVTSVNQVTYPGWFEKTLEEKIAYLTGYFSNSEEGSELETSSTSESTYLEELEELRLAIVDLGVYDVDEELGQQTLEVPNTEGETVDRAWFYMCNEGEEELTRVTVAYFSNGNFDITGGVFGRVTSVNQVTYPGWFEKTLQEKIDYLIGYFSDSEEGSELETSSTSESTYLEELEELRLAIVDLGVYDVSEEIGKQTIEISETEGESVDQAWFYVYKGQESLSVTYFSDGGFQIWYQIPSGTNNLSIVMNGETLERTNEETNIPAGFSDFSNWFEWSLEKKVDYITGYFYDYFGELEELHFELSESNLFEDHELSDLSVKTNPNRAGFGISKGDKQLSVIYYENGNLRIELSQETTPPIHWLEKTLEEKVDYITEYFSDSSLDDMVNSEAPVLTSVEVGDEIRKKWGNLWNIEEISVIEEQAEEGLEFFGAWELTRESDDKSFLIKVDHKLDSGEYQFVIKRGSDYSLVVITTTFYTVSELSDFLAVFSFEKRFSNGDVVRL